MSLKKYDSYTLIGVILITFTVLGKVGSILGNSLIAQASEGLWIVASILLVAANRRMIPFPKRMRLMVFFGVLLWLFENINSLNPGYREPGLYRNIIVVSSIYWVLYTLIITDKDRIVVFLNIYTTTSAVLAICSLFFSNISFNEWMTSQVYLFGGLGEKNALGQIFATSILIEFFVENSNKTIRALIVKCFKIGIIFAGLIFVQCRTAIIALGILWLLHIVLYKEYRLFKIIGTGLAIVLANIFNLTDIISKSLFLDKYAGQGISAFTSGRMDLWMEALNNFNIHMLLGCGSYYVDNAYINALANYGIIFGVGYILIIVYNIIVNLIDSKYTQQPSIVIMSTIFMFIVTIFEAIPPFGPGVSAVCFWLISAYVDISKGELL